MTGRIEGRVKWFDTVKRFGFIAPEDSALGDAFAHHSEIQMGPGQRTLETGQRVSYVPQTEPKGTRATQIVPLADGEAR